jgi:hypothetical protein
MVSNGCSYLTATVCQEGVSFPAEEKKIVYVFFN